MIYHKQKDTLTTRDIIDNNYRYTESEKITQMVIDYKKKKSKPLLDLIMSATMPYIIKIIDKSLYTTTGIDKDDIFQTAITGLMYAIDKYDADKGVEFMSFAYLYIRGYILGEIRYMKYTISNSNYTDKRIADINDCEEELSAMLGRHPKDDELISYFNNSYRKKYENIDYLLNEDRLNKCREYGERLKCISIFSPVEASVDNHEVLTIEDMTESPIDYQQEVIEAVDGSRLYEKILKVVGKKRTAEIICKYYGICGFDEMTQEEIGQEYELTKQRISELIKNNKEKLKSLYKTN